MDEKLWRIHCSQEFILLTIFTLFTHLFMSVMYVFMDPFWLAILSFKIIIQWISRKLPMHMLYAISTQNVTCHISVSKIHNSKNAYFMNCGSCFWVKIPCRNGLLCWCYKDPYSLRHQSVTTHQRQEESLQYWQ